MWGGECKGDTENLQVLQNQAARHVLLLPPRANRNSMFDKLDWMTVNQLTFYHTVLTVFKIRQTGEPEYLAEKLKSDNFRGNLIVPVSRLVLSRSSFCIRGGEWWLSVPVQVRTIHKISRFKKALKAWTKSNVPRFL